MNAENVKAVRKCVLFLIGNPASKIRWINIRLSQQTFIDTSKRIPLQKKRHGVLYLSPPIQSCVYCHRNLELKVCEPIFC